jgi:hypothetical protein
MTNVCDTNVVERRTTNLGRTRLWVPGIREESAKACRLFMFDMHDNSFSVSHFTWPEPR